MAAIETLFESVIDKRMDRFEVFCLKNVFALPADVSVTLPHYKELNPSVSKETEMELDFELEGLWDALVQVLSLTPGETTQGQIATESKTARQSHWQPIESLKGI